MTAAADAGPARRAVRRFVLATSVPPLLHAYRGVYGAVTWLAVRIFRRYPAVRAVYLTRGSAKGEILPLVSDVDFLVIHEGLTARDRAELMKAYDGLSRATRLLDSHIQLLDDAWFRRQIELDDHFRLRFAEGRATWKLVHGRDYVRQLPAPDRDALDPGLLAETKVWWGLFAWRLFGPRRHSAETVTRNNVCYKAVSECMKAMDGITRRRLTFSRADALRAARDALAPSGRALVERLEALQARRFRPRDPRIIEDTTAFLLERLDRFYGELEAHPLARRATEAPVRVDAPAGEEPFGPAAVDDARRLVGSIEREWGGALMGAHLVTGVHFSPDELVLLLAADPSRPPSLELMQRAFALHQAHAPTARHRIRLFLLLAAAAFQLDPDDLEKSWQSILWRPGNPDAFALAAMPERCLLGTPLAASAPPAWTVLIRDFLAAEEVAFAHLLADPAVYKLGNRDFLRVFWKTAQIVAINRAAAPGGEIVYPLTPRAVARALAAQATPLPRALEPLLAAMESAGAGAEPDLAELVPGAIGYLGEIRT
ncbi:MAG TPA: hypothetical protein VFW66_07675 [Gemmatimonadales bacterium]|nr:hypothetical protein [Gemmatimonadales bacterium]